MSDASGGDKFGLLGAVAYLRIEYMDNSFIWHNLASMCKIAPANMTIVVRELRALLLSIKLADNLIFQHIIYLASYQIYVSNYYLGHCDQLDAFCNTNGPQCSPK